MKLNGIFRSYIPLKADYANHSGEPQKKQCVQQRLPHFCRCANRRTFLTFKALYTIRLCIEGFSRKYMI